MMEGRFQTAFDAATHIAAQVTDDYPEADRFRPLAWFTLARFDRFDALARQPAPPPSQLFATAMWHYTQTLAAAAQHRPDDARQHLAALHAIVDSDEGRAFEQPFFFGYSQLTTARHVAEAALASATGRLDAAIDLLRHAVECQDSLEYMEPPYWYYPVRQSLGGALLAADRPAQAEAVFRDDLRINPNNGWSLFGLAQALHAQGKLDSAEHVRRQFETAWVRADSDPVLWPF